MEYLLDILFNYISIIYFYVSFYYTNATQLLEKLELTTKSRRIKIFNNSTI